MANAGVNDPHGATLVINSIAKPRATHNFVLPLLKTHSPHPDPGKLTSKLVLSVAMRAWIAGNGNPRSISGFWMKGEEGIPPLSCCKVDGLKHPRLWPGYLISAFSWHKGRGLAALSGAGNLGSIPCKR